ncbi:hypothetical protein SESBI_02433 [Sesbania bispinosa]|nr:hypothetical protein SESBI_02433 [Sesbania bispinosa]
MLKDELATYYSRRQEAEQNKPVQGDIDNFLSNLSKHPRGKRPRIEPGVETNNHSTPNLISERHLNNVKNPTNANQTGNVLLFASPLGNIPEDSQSYTLKSFEGFAGQMVDSIWDPRFPAMELVDAHFRKEKDRENVRKLGLRNSSRAITTFGVRTAFLGREIEVELGRLDQENCALPHELESSVSKKPQDLIFYQNIAESMKNPQIIRDSLGSLNCRLIRLDEKTISSLKEELAAYTSRRQEAEQNKPVQGDTDYFFATLSKHPRGKRPRIEPRVETNNHSTPNMITKRHMSNVKSPTNVNQADNVLRFASPLGDSQRSTLKDFENFVGQMVDSIWDPRFPTMELVDTHFRKEKDQEKVRKLGLRNSSRAITTFGVQTAFLGREIEYELGRLDQENYALRRELESSEKKWLVN